MLTPHMDRAVEVRGSGKKTQSQGAGALSGVRQEKKDEKVLTIRATGHKILD
jgi:hypothetical protein